MLAFATELRGKVETLLEDVGALALVSGIGFEVADAELYADNRRNLAAGPWRYLELPEAADSAMRALDEAWEDPTVVVLVPESLPRPLLVLVRAFIDRRDRVDLGDFEKRHRRTDQSLVLLVNGAPEPERIPDELRHVPCWEFVP